MGVIQQKLIQDFFEADGVNKLIIKKNVLKDEGVQILKDLINIVLDDIKTLDKDAYKELEKKIADLNKVNSEKKSQIIKGLAEPEDSIQQRQRDNILLEEDHKKYQHLLLVIQNLCYRKGWFD